MSIFVAGKCVVCINFAIYNSYNYGHVRVYNKSVCDPREKNAQPCAMHVIP